MKKSYLSAISAVIILYAATVFFNAHFAHTLAMSGKTQDMIERIFGGFRNAVADWSFMKAEEYHHRGMPFLSAVAIHEGELLTGGEGHDEHEEESGHEARGAVPAGPGSLYSKIYGNIKITKDSHLKPAEEKEALPWFYIEVRFNPHDIRGYVLGGYWLERMGRYEEAMKFLNEGEKNNPDSAEILAAIGELYYSTKMTGKAVQYLERSCRLWIAARPPNTAADRYSKSDRFFAMNFLGDLYLKLGRKAEALAVFRQLYKLEPSAKVVSDKIKKLQ